MSNNNQINQSIYNPKYDIQKYINTHFSIDKRKLYIFALAVISFSLSIVYTNVQTYDSELTPAMGYSDSIDYINMYYGKSGTGIRAYRPLVPTLARFIPDIPSYLFTPSRTINSSTQVIMKFGVINLFFLIAACCCLFALQRGFEQTYEEAFLGSMLFLSTQTIIRSAGLPMVDTAFYFFFALTMLSIQTNRLWLYFFSVTIGVLVKELVLLSIPLIILSLLPKRRKIAFFITSLPAIAIYAFIRITYADTAIDEYITGQILSNTFRQLMSIFTINGLLNLFLSFGLAWFPATYALIFTKLSPLLKRWKWLIPIVIAGVIMGSGNLGRSTFTAFPVILTLATKGCSCWITGFKNQD